MVGPGGLVRAKQQSLLASGGGGGGGGGVDFAGLETAGTFLNIAGLVNGAIGSFFSAKSQQNQLESQALSADFASRMADINARSAEADAAAIREAGRRERLSSTLRAGAFKEAERAGFGARGLQVGRGTAAEVLASAELVKEIDALNIDESVLRSSASARRRGVDARTASEFAAVSASNIRGLKGSISPAVSGLTSLIGGAGRFAGEVAQNKRLEALFAK